MEELRTKQRERQATEKLKQRRKSRCLAQPTWVQEAPKPSGRACLQVRSPWFPPPAPSPGFPPNPFPSPQLPHSPDLPAPRRPRIARLTSRGALCGPLPTRDFPNTEDMVTLRRRTRGLCPRAPSSVPARRGPQERVAGSLGTCHRPRRCPRREPRAERAVFPLLCSSWGKEGLVEPGGRGRPERRRTPCKGCGSPPRGSLTPLRREGWCSASRAPHRAWPREPGRYQCPDHPQTRQERTRTGERKAQGREIERKDVSSLV